ncbi:MAG: family 1 glycosylhydrolase [Bacteriovoracaceae bacterium]
MPNYVSKSLYFLKLIALIVVLSACDMAKKIDDNSGRIDRANNNIETTNNQLDEIKKDLKETQELLKETVLSLSQTSLLLQEIVKPITDIKSQLDQTLILLMDVSSTIGRMIVPMEGIASHAENIEEGLQVINQNLPGMTTALKGIGILANNINEASSSGELQALFKQLSSSEEGLGAMINESLVFFRNINNCFQPAFRHEFINPMMSEATIEAKLSEKGYILSLEELRSLETTSHNMILSDHSFYKIPERLVGLISFEDKELLLKDGKHNLCLMVQQSFKAGTTRFVQNIGSMIKSMDMNPTSLMNMAQKAMQGDQVDYPHRYKVGGEKSRDELKITDEDKSESQKIEERVAELEAISTDVSEKLKKLKALGKGEFTKEYRLQNFKFPEATGKFKALKEEVLPDGRTARDITINESYAQMDDGGAGGAALYAVHGLEGFFNTLIAPAIAQANEGKDLPYGLLFDLKRSTQKELGVMDSFFQYYYETQMGVFLKRTKAEREELYELLYDSYYFIYELQVLRLVSKSLKKGEDPSGSEKKKEKIPLSTTLAEFPDDFSFGVANAAQQVEDQPVASDSWNLFADDNKIPAFHNVSVPKDKLRFWTEPERELDAAKELNGNSSHSSIFRMSIDWARIFPTLKSARENKPNLEALKHYRKILEKVKKRGMKPVITLFHHAEPQWSLDLGSWNNSEVQLHFVKFGKLVIDHLNDLVDSYTFFNEPHIYVLFTYTNVIWPSPLEQKTQNITDIAQYVSDGNYGVFYQQLNRMALAHGELYDYVKTKTPNKKVGIAHRVDFYHPQNETADKKTVENAHLWFNLRPLDFFISKLDYIGINYYGVEVLSEFDLVFADNVLYSDAGRGVYPDGLYYLLKLLDKRYNKERVNRLESDTRNLSFLITENGLADSSDNIRPSYIIEHLLVLSQLMKEGLKIDGYLYWSITDNFEWSDGYCPKFGLISVDRSTPDLKRTKRGSFRYLQMITEKRKITQYLREAAWSNYHRVKNRDQEFCRATDAKTPLHEPELRPFKFIDWRSQEFKLETPNETH